MEIGARGTRAAWPGAFRRTRRVDPVGPRRSMFGRSRLLALVCVVKVVEGSWFSRSTVRTLSSDVGRLGVNTTWLAERVEAGAFFASRAADYGPPVKTQDSRSMISLLTAPFFGDGLEERAVTFKGDGGTRPPGPGGSLRSDSDSDSDSLRALLGPERSDLDEGRVSAVLRLEALAGDRASEREAAEAVAELFPAPIFDAGRGDTAHVYVSAPGAAALGNHTDLTDILVLQIGGTKEWSVCPPLPVEHPSFPKLETCASYDGEEMATIERCETLVLEPGDLLFIPRRSVHSARALEDASTHVTLGLATPTTAERCEAAGGLEAFHADVAGRRRLAVSVPGHCSRGTPIYCTPCPVNSYAAAVNSYGAGCWRASWWMCNGGPCYDECGVWDLGTCDSDCYTWCTGCHGCVECPIGTDTRGQQRASSCTDCKAGTYGTAAGATCVTCTAGYYCPGKTRHPCAVGTRVGKG